MATTTSGQECRRKCDPREETRQQHKAEALLKEATGFFKHPSSRLTSDQVKIAERVKGVGVLFHWTCEAVVAGSNYLGTRHPVTLCLCRKLGGSGIGVCGQRTGNLIGFDGFVQIRSGSIQIEPAV